MTSTTTTTTSVDTSKSNNINNNCHALAKILRQDSNSIVVLDGGTGEELFRRGVPDDRNIWSATAVVNEAYHDILRQVHRSFVQAGAQLITTNSYGIVPGVGFAEENIKRHCETAGRLARQVADERPGTMVLGSLGPLLESYRPDKVMEHDQGVAVYETMARALLPFVDAFLAETMSSLEESTQAVDAVSKLTIDHTMPCLVSYTLNAQGNLRSGENVTHAIPRLLDFAEQRNVQGMYTSAIAMNTLMCHKDYL